MEEKWLRIIYATIFFAGLLITVLTFFQNRLMQSIERNRLLEQGNPLFPVKIKGVIKLDFSKAKEDRLKIIENYKNYLLQFLDSNGNYYNHLGRELPKDLILNYDAVTYKNFKMKQSPDDNNGSGEFYLNHTQFANAFLPKILLAFMEKDELKSNFNDNKINLLLQIFSFDTYDSTDIELTYRLEFKTKMIILEFTTNKPKVETNDGLIKSIFSCKNGWVGIGFDDFIENGIECNPERIEINYGIDFVSNTTILFNDQSKYKYRKINDDFYRRRYYFKKGTDILEQHNN